MMNIYPLNIPIAIGSSTTTIAPANRSQSEAGYIFTKRKFTRVKSKFSLNYPALTKEQFTALNTFFIQNQGKKFSFTHPYDSIERICIFAIDELVANHDTSDLVSTKVEIVEV